LIVGIPVEWADLIDPMVPQILSLVIDSWGDMPSPASDEKEDNITISLWRLLKQNKSVRGLPFRITIQRFELDPLAGEELGRQDIVFEPLHPCEDIYFCLESKRLNVIKGGNLRSYASEYVTHGMLRFVTGQYSKAVRHGGMIGYVLDAKIATAISNMKAPGEFLPSTVLIGETRARETHHQRKHETALFRIHHLFMAGRCYASS
jgi:hypothetical protein